MKVVVQRVKHASVSIAGNRYAAIEKGLLLLVGFEEEETEEELQWLINKLMRLRIFADDNGVMNLSLEDVNGSVLIVSQFTLHASTKKGNRPSYLRAAKPEIALSHYNRFVKQFKIAYSGLVAEGQFGADMQVELINDGPVTIIIDTKNKE